AIKLTPAIKYTLEQALDFIEDAELVAVTPKEIRLRKKHLSETDRKTASRSACAGRCSRGGGPGAAAPTLVGTRACASSATTRGRGQMTTGRRRATQAPLQAGLSRPSSGGSDC